MNRFDVPAESFQLRSSVQTATNSLGESKRERERESTTLARSVFTSHSIRQYGVCPTSVLLYLLLTRARAPRQYNKFLLRQ